MPKVEKSSKHCKVDPSSSRDADRIAEFESRMEKRSTVERLRYLDREGQLRIMKNVEEWFKRDPRDQYGGPASWDIRANQAMKEAGHPTLAELRDKARQALAEQQESTDKRTENEKPIYLNFQVDIPKSFLTRSTRILSIRVRFNSDGDGTCTVEGEEEA